MPSLSFDQVAHAYDATRGYPYYVAQQIAYAIENAADATTQTKFLEVGIGTGRIALPLASLGHIYTGVDISEKMVEQLEVKLRLSNWQEQQQSWGSLPDEDPKHVSIVRRFIRPEQRASMRLVMSDMTKLPFYNASFDVAVAVHVFHLVDGWQHAVQEVLRVLRCWDEHGKLDVQDISEEWYRTVQKLGGESRRPGASSVHFVTEWLRERGLQSEKLRAFTWERLITPRQIVENITQRLWSNTWSVPDNIFVPAAEHLIQWTDERYGADMDTARKQECRFIISRTRV